jgi:hypothetical protein
MLFVNRFILCAVLLAWLPLSAGAAEKIKVLLIDGQNNHDWKSTSPLIKAILENTNLFTVTVSTQRNRTGMAPEIQRLRRRRFQLQRRRMARGCEEGIRRLRQQRRRIRLGSRGQQLVPEVD